MVGVREAWLEGVRFHPLLSLIIECELSFHLGSLQFFVVVDGGDHSVAHVFVIGQSCGS